MKNDLNKLMINELWEELLNSKKELIIATVVTKDIGKNWCFSFRNKIIRRLAPKYIKVLNLEFDKSYCKEISESSNDKSGHLTIHGVMINDLINLINEESYCLLIDIDAFPLSQDAIKIAFATAFLKGVNGNIQRTNCLNNKEHIFIAESFMCFYTKKIKSIGSRAWKANERSDVSEEISWEWPEILDENVFVPLSTVFKPIWPLRGSKPIYGIGTVFAFNNIKISYHHFFARSMISRYHFFIISFFYYFQINFNPKNFKPLSNKDLKIFINELKFAVKYLLGKVS